MPRDGSGNYSLPTGNPVVTNTVISSSGWANPTLSDIAAAITQSMSRDGQTTPTANLTMGNFRLLNLGNAQARSDAITAGQVQDDAMVQLSSIAGTGDAITAATAPAITVYAKGSRFLYIPTAANTLTNPTIAIDGLTAQTITQSNGVGLWSGALVVGTPYEIVYDGTNFRVQSGQLGSPVPIFGSQTSHRNYLVDGNFDLWRTGTSFTFGSGISGYTADMWICAAGSGGSITVTPQVFAPGTEAAGMTTPATYYLQFAQTVSATSGNGIVQRVLGVYKLEGRTATLSMWLWVASGTITVPSASIVQQFGTGGSSAVTTNVTTNWTITTTPQRFSVAIALPSISGKTIGTGNNWLTVQLNLPASVTFTLNTTQWQLEASPANAPAAGLPTPFEFHGYDQETARVNNFVQILINTAGYSLQGFGTGVFTSATNFQAWCPFSVPMQTQPILTFLSGSATSLGVQSGSLFTPTAVAVVTTASSERGLVLNITVSGATAGQGGLVRANAGCTMIADARL